MDLHVCIEEEFMECNGIVGVYIPRVCLLFKIEASSLALFTLSCILPSPKRPKTNASSPPLLLLTLKF